MSYPPPPAPGPHPPPQPYGGYGGAQPPYPPQKKGGKGCLVAVLVTLGVTLVLCAVGAYVTYRLLEKVEGTVPGLGGVECPSVAEVSDVVGYDVELTLEGNLVVAAGCTYSGSGVGVTIVKGAGVIADEEIQDVETEARTLGTTATPIDVGDDGVAFGSARRSEAITKADGGVVGVEIFADGAGDIGDRRDAAVELLELFIELQ